MEFVLDFSHRKTSDNELLTDLKRVASLLQQESLTQKEYKQHGNYNPATLTRRFGSWNEALKEAGLVLERVKLYKQHKYCESDEAFFEDLRRVAQQLGKLYVSKNEYEKHGIYASSIRQKKYRGWNGLLNAAGLEPTPFRTGPNRKYTDKEIFEEIERVWILLGRQPKYIEARNGGLFRFSGDLLCNHFGSWRKALEAFVTYINSDEDDNMGNETISKGNEASNIENGQKVTTLTERPERQYIHKTNRQPSNKLKVQVLMRDGNCCRLCGVPCNDGFHKIHFDHIIPWSKGGETTLDNLQILCSDCNLAKSNLLIDNE